jgi:type III pantothenate kinase
MFGTAAMVDGLVERVAAEMGADVRVVATGGLASSIAELCSTIEKVEPTLTLIGLRLIFELNVTDGSSNR